MRRTSRGSEVTTQFGAIRVKDLHSGVVSRSVVPRYVPKRLTVFIAGIPQMKHKPPRCLLVDQP